MSKLILSVDDGCQSDLIVAELARKYKIETIFYWPIEWRSLAYDKGYQPLSFMDASHIAEDFEIGAHTITHRHLTAIPIEEAIVEIVECKYMLKLLFPNQEIKRFCPPRGYTNEALNQHINMFYKSSRLTKGPNLVHIHPNSGANNNRPWRECIDENTTEIWCHSWELNRFELWDELEDCLANLPS